MRNLWLSSVVILSLAACTSVNYKQLIKAESPSPDVPSSLLSTDSGSFLFKANLKLYNKSFSGLLITKHLPTDEYRVVFTTEMGIKLFDFGFRDTSFTLHYCVPQLNRKKFLNVIKQDLETALMLNIDKHKYEVYHKKDDSLLVFKRSDLSHDLYYYQQPSIGRVVKIEKAKKKKIQVIYKYDDFKNEFPHRISIDHKDMQLDIALYYLNK